MGDPRELRGEATALVKELMERLERDGVDELRVTRGELAVRVRRATARNSGPGAPALAQASVPSGLEAAQADAPAPPASDVLEVAAPLTGIFYRAPSPQAPPFVQVGSSVSVGQVIGLIEAMKLFNEIRSTAAGRVRRILVESGQLVRAHAPLIEVEPL